jgi:sensor c-di-GMP phosphodiesterase-like protein
VAGNRSRLRRRESHDKWLRVAVAEDGGIFRTKVTSLTRTFLKGLLSTADIKIGFSREREFPMRFIGRPMKAVLAADSSGMLKQFKSSIPVILPGVVCALAGIFCGFWLGRAMLQRTARATLGVYADQIRHNADDLSDEIGSIFREFDAASLSKCSDHDIAVLQAWTFRSGYVKDIGRTREGMLYCSAFLGRLREPYAEGAATFYLSSGNRVYTNMALKLASMGGDHGTIVESSGTNVVLNPTAFAHWDRPYLSYMVTAINRDTGRMVKIAGSTLPVDTGFVISQRAQTIRGTILSSVCSSRNPVCVVTSEQVLDVWRGSRSTQFAYSAMGGFAGLSLGLALSVFYRRTVSLSHQLHRAIRKESASLYLVYQPIVDVQTGRSTGAEALLRWSDQEGAVVSPDLFVSIAEEKGFIGELTAFVVRCAMRDLGDLLRSHENFHLSINIAASDIGSDEFVKLLDQNVIGAGIRARQISLELTERSTANVAAMRAAIQRLGARGYKVHIDDFGTGFSSLSYIDQLHVNAIKIDRAFTRTIGTEAMIAPVLRQMLEMASALGVEVVVEGVETAIQRDYLAGFDKTLRAQGWYFSRPMSAAAIRAFHANNQVPKEPLKGLLQIESSSSCEYPMLTAEVEDANELPRVEEVLETKGAGL